MEPKYRCRRTWVRQGERKWNIVGIEIRTFVDPNGPPRIVTQGRFLDGGTVFHNWAELEELGWEEVDFEEEMKKARDEPRASL